jgi:hypothetical protein
MRREAQRGIGGDGGPSVGKAYSDGKAKLVIGVVVYAERCGDYPVRVGLDVRGRDVGDLEPGGGVCGGWEYREGGYEGGENPCGDARGGISGRNEIRSATRDSVMDFTTLPTEHFYALLHLDLRLRADEAQHPVVGDNQRGITPLRQIEVA